MKANLFKTLEYSHDHSRPQLFVGNTLERKINLTIHGIMIHYRDIEQEYRKLDEIMNSNTIEKKKPGRSY